MFQFIFCLETKETKIQGCIKLWIANRINPPKANHPLDNFLCHVAYSLYFKKQLNSLVYLQFIVKRKLSIIYILQPP